MFDVGLGLPWNLLAQQLGQAQPAQDLQQLNGLLASVSGAAPSASNQREFESGGDSDELPGRGGGRAKSNRSQNQGANADYAVRHQVLHFRVLFHRQAQLPMAMCPCATTYTISNQLRLFNRLQSKEEGLASMKGAFCYVARPWPGLSRTVVLGMHIDCNSYISSLQAQQGWFVY